MVEETTNAPCVRFGADVVDEPRDVLPKEPHVPFVVTRSHRSRIGEGANDEFELRLGPVRRRVLLVGHGEPQST